MSPFMLRLVALVLLVAQGLGVALPSGVMVCLGPGRDAVPGVETLESPGGRDAGPRCCAECAAEIPVAPQPEAAWPVCNAPCDCCVSVPHAAQVRVETERTGRELRIALESLLTAGAALPCTGWPDLALDLDSVPNARCHPPDRTAAGTAVGLRTTRLNV